VVGESLKGALLIAETLGSLGYPCNPPRDQLQRTDIIQARVRLRVRLRLR